MTDSPAFRAPCIAEEQPILDELLVIRDHLLLLKQDKSKYVKSQDVIGYYDRILDQVDALNKIREKCDARTEQNRLDTVLDDCFQLISLFFLTIGRNNEAPATWSVASTIKRLLDHLKEAGFFTGKDLTGISRQLDLIKEKVERGRDHHSPHILKLLDARVEICQATLAELKRSLSGLSPELIPIHEKLVSILRTASGLNVKGAVSKYPDTEMEDLHKQLLQIKESFEGEEVVTAPKIDSSALERYAEKLKHITYGEDSVKSGHDLIRELLDRTLLWFTISKDRRGRIDERFRDKFENLIAIKNQLEKLQLTQAWSLRETDLYSYQRRLDRVDEARVDGNFVDANGVPSELYEQRGLLYLLRRSYAMIYQMITLSEPVSEALIPIYNQLSTLKKCLLEVKKAGGVSSPRELYPYSMKINSIDNMRQDGKFVINGEIPEGQASVVELLNECFELQYEMRAEVEADGEDDDDDRADSGVHLNKDDVPLNDDSDLEDDEPKELTRVETMTQKAANISISAN